MYNPHINEWKYPNIKIQAARNRDGFYNPRQKITTESFLDLSPFLITEENISRSSLNLKLSLLKKMLG